MNFNYFHKQVNNYISNEINYKELKEISIKIFNISFNDLKKYEKNFNIYVIKKLYNESNYEIKLKLLFHIPDFYLIILNDFIKYIYNSFNSDVYLYHIYMVNKEGYIINLYNEYIKILNNHLNINLNDELYKIQTNIIINLAELKQRKDLEKSINDLEKSINDLENLINNFKLDY